MRQLISDSRSPHTKAARFTPFALGWLACWLFPAVLFSAPTITYVQGNSAVPQTPQTSVSVTFTAAQAAGDLNVVAAGWNDSTATVSSVTDTNGNVYTRAVGPTVQTGAASQSIYYARNIVAAAAGANIVTVTFSSGAIAADIRILEYKGADPNNPVDVAAASSGSSATGSSGAATTTNPTDLIFGANLVQTVTTGPGSGFTKRLLTSPDGDIAEDKMVTTVGSYSATAPNTSGKWIMQMVAFRTPAAVTGPTVTSVSPNSGVIAGGTVVTITGANFATGATVTFGSTPATNVVVVSSTSITAITPVGTAGAVTVTVTVSGQSASLIGGFTYVGAPTVTGVSPNTGSTSGGTAVTITGTNFATGATVTFGSTAATTGVVVSNTSITATTPAAGTAGAVTVTVTNIGAQSGNLANGFTYALIPTVTSVSPNGGPAAGGTAVTITGTNFASPATVTFGEAAATNVGVVGATSITAITPAGTAGPVTVTVNVGGQSGILASGYTYAAPPTVTNVAPNTGPTAGGTAITITGTNFVAGATVQLGTAAATNVVVMSGTSITATTPAGSVGAVTMTVTNQGGQSGGLVNAFTYVPAQTTITYVQGNSATPQTAQTSVPVTFTAAQAAGDLNVVAAGWNDSTATVSSVTDRSGNTYTRAVGPTVQTGAASQSIYYARNIVAAAAGANIVTVTFSSGATSADIRILEYKGADTNNPVDVAAASSGSSTTGSSGAATTTSPTDLIFGANLVQTVTTGPGSGFTKRLLTSPDGDIAEDEMVTTVGSYSATAPNTSGKWIMQMVAFRAAGSDTTPPTAPTNLTAAVSGSQINLSWTASTDNVGVTGYIVQRCAGNGCTTFGQIGTPATTTYSDTNLAAGSYSYRVQASDAAGNLSAFSNTATGVITASAPAPSITSLSPASGAAGSSITITGANFGNSQGSSTVSFNQTAAAATNWSESTIVATVPVGATSGNVVVTVGGVASNGVNFTVELGLPSSAQVLSAIRTVNNYWIANNTAGNSDWTQATYFTGDLAAYDATGQSNYLTFAQSWASSHNYSLDTGNTTNYANYQAAGQVYIRLYQLDPVASDIAGITTSINGMITSLNNSGVDNEWTWIDAINMSMPDFVELALINTGTNYYNPMYSFYSYAKYSLGLYDTATGLWWENSTYADTSTYWSRGNGWVFAAHAKVLSTLPTTDPHYAEYRSTFIGMAQALAARQQPGGYWNADLGGTDYAGPESSGTSFFLYGFAWGVNNGILDKNTYTPVMANAWNFLANTAIQPSGLLGYVQPTGSAPGPTTATTTEDFGVGAFLLAAQQMALLTN
jgi:rhamnogalacturonyl hydrolase YesR